MALLLPAYVCQYAHNDGCSCTCPMMTGDVVSLLLGDERPRSAMAASFAVVLPVLLREFLAAGAAVAVGAPLSVRSFHLRLAAVAAVALNRIIRHLVINVPVKHAPSVGVLDGLPCVVFKRPVVPLLIGLALPRALTFKPVGWPVGCQTVSRLRLLR